VDFPQTLANFNMKSVTEACKLRPSGAEVEIPHGPFGGTFAEVWTPKLRENAGSGLARKRGPWFGHKTLAKTIEQRGAIDYAIRVD
jgi:hypothetical protein